MKIDFSQKLYNLNGDPIKDGGKDMMLKDACATALLSERIPTQREGAPSADEKTKRLRLAIKIDCSKDSILELDAKDVAYIQDLLNVFNPLVCGQARLLLDGKTMDDLKKELCEGGQ